MSLSKRTGKKSFVCFAFLCVAVLAAQDIPAPKSSATTEKPQAILKVTVTDRNERVVTGLKAEDFKVYEDGLSRQIISASLSDTPVCLGIALDSSGSMRQSLPAVAEAVFDFVKAANPEDEIFLVNFNDRLILEQDFTKDLKLIHAALKRADARGGTALYDSVMAAAGHLAKRITCNDRILVVVSDGEDNESSQSLEGLIRAFDNFRGVSVYAVGLLSERTRARRALRTLSLETGGVALFADRLKDVKKTLKSAMEQIRNQYSITYVPGDANGKSQHQIRVFANGRGNDLTVGAVRRSSGAIPPAPQ